MNRPLFLRIARDLEAHDSYFSMRRNCAGVPGLHPYQKLTSAFRILAYGISADLTDEYCRLAKSTALENLRRFVSAIIEVYGGQYLRSPNAEDTARLLAIGERRGFPGMLGSIDCMHWQWKNYPTAHKGFFVGHNRVPTIILEAVASQDLWIWHSFFGLLGSHNDINVLHRSPVFALLPRVVEELLARRSASLAHLLPIGLFEGDVASSSNTLADEPGVSMDDVFYFFSCGRDFHFSVSSNLLKQCINPNDLFALSSLAYLTSA
jgi:hypothetical protein